MQVAHNILHNMFVVDHSLLHSYQLLREYRVVYVQLFVSLLELLELLLGGYQLSIDKIHLLCWNRFVDDLGRLPWRWGLPTDVIQRILVVSLEFGMLELPSLWSSAIPSV